MFPPTQEHLHWLFQTKCCHSSLFVKNVCDLLEILIRIRVWRRMKILSDSVNSLIAYLFLHTFPSYVDINLDCWLNLLAALYIEEYTIISPVSISRISTFFGLLRMYFRKFYLGFLSFLLSYRSGSEVIVVIFIVSGSNLF